MDLGPRKQRFVLAVLALEAGKPVEMARLVDPAWPDDPPRTAPHAIRVCVSGLRSALRGVPGLEIRLRGAGMRGVIRSRELASSSLALAREPGDQRIAVDANNTLGTATRLLGDPATALRCHQEALKTASEAGYGKGEASALIGLAQDQFDLGDRGEARSTIERALLVTRQTGLRLLEGHALTALAAIALDAGQRDESTAHAAAALAVHRETGYRLGESRTGRILGILQGTAAR
jgi:tetratricopeptide (TPR) repeat protein